MASPRVMAVMKDPERVVPGDVAWGDGYSNKDADALIAIASDLKAIPDDDECDVLVPRGVDVAVYSGLAIRVLAQTHDARFDLLNSPVAQMWREQAADFAAKTVSPYGNASGDDYQGKLAGVRDASRREQEAAAAKKVEADFSAKRERERARRRAQRAGDDAG